MASEETERQGLVALYKQVCVVLEEPGAKIP
jgi:hypothetical protein